ncbi:MAG TPA: hypothetical protein VGK00_15675 [Anaerolineales bacterium]
MQKPLYSIHSPLENIRALYDVFDEPICSIDCGQKCAPYNPSGKPFCCDICHAVPAAYHDEWTYLKPNTRIWHAWRGDECADTVEEEREKLRSETPASMLLLACLGPSKCERPFRALSCRQFPFFPYVTSDYRFVGLAYEWEFEQVCWVVRNLDVVSPAYRRQFLETHDRLFAFSQEIFDSYQLHSERMRAHYAVLRRRFPVLHRNGGLYLVSPRSERMARVKPRTIIKPGSRTG